MYSAKGGQIMRLKYVPIYSQYKNNIFWILKTAISKNDMELTGTCGMSDINVPSIYTSHYQNVTIFPSYRCNHVFATAGCRIYLATYFTILFLFVILDSFSRCT